ncbi:MAG: hypothetical protein KJ042_13210 [Deltaproteobacteria bacterium]|nr:hypothetical protein [Deltaproteobacteria bacterium]
MRYLKHALVLLVTGPIAFLTLFVLFGKVGPERFCPADSGAVIYLPDILGTADKALSSQGFRTLADAGMGGGSFSGMFRDMEKLRQESFLYTLIRSLSPKIAVAVPADLDWYGTRQVPILSIVDLGRPMLLLSAIGLADNIKRGQSLGSYMGHPLSVDGETATTVIRNIVVMGTDADVKKAIEAYEGAKPSLMERKADLRKALRMIDDDAEIYGVLLSSKILAPTVSFGDEKSKTDIPEASFERGAFDVALDSDGVHVRAVLEAASGKSVFSFLESGEKPFEMAKYLSEKPLLAFGLRAENLAALTPTFIQMTRFAEGEDAAKSGQRKRFVEMLYTELLSSVGPDVMYFTTENNDWCAVMRLRNPEAMGKILAGYAGKDKPRNPEDFEGLIKAGLETPGALKSLIENGTLTIQDLRQAVGVLPPELATLLTKALPELETVLAPGMPSIHFLGKTIYYDVSGDLALFSTSIDEMRRMTGGASDGLSTVRVFFDGDPNGSAFFAADVKQTIVRKLGGAEDPIQFSEKLRGPWTFVAQVKDETTRVEIEAGLQADLEIVQSRPARVWIYSTLLLTLKLLVVVLGVYCAYVFAKRVARIANEVRGVPAPAQKRGPAPKNTTAARRR